MEESMNKTASQGNPSFPALLILLILGLGGCFAVYTSGAPEFSFVFAMRQLLWLGFGLVIYLLLSWIPFSLYREYAWYPAGVSLLLLVLVLLFGSEINGMRGWFRIGSLVNLQPSEFAKGPFLLLISQMAAGPESEKIRFYKILLTGGLFCGLVFVEPDFGSATVFFLGIVLVLTVSGIRLRRLLIPFSAGFLGLAAFLLFHPYARNRILGYLNPDSDPGGAGWHIRQFQYTIAHGGFFGSEPGSASWAGSYLPLSHSDSAFASIVESGGLLGGVIVIVGFLLLALIFRDLSLNVKNPAARIYIFSAGALCTGQALLHIGVNAALLPPTGLTLPIFSYGGSSLLGTMILFGIAAGAARESE